ncbi:PHO85 cyclin-1 [Lodderomyces elongisporus]|uniref:PHO85 cyclin-1 n=1 Tax=Lodderomyces elongisporus TaxID=36914 RepID=UPI00291EE00A|nr:PHO85 cyclin-1 [Lodderomyces elongisporus]WLF80843.1 PHO85 cyclin-1 [Lodderomyces elongisporus]
MVSALDLQALNIFLNGPITHDMIHKLVVATLQVIPCKDTKSQTYTTTNNTVKQLPSLMTFLTKLIKYTNVYTGTLMATLVYLQKLKNKLPQNAQGLPCTRHRILLSCLILSSKFHNDSSPKNKHWAKYTDGLFNVKDINLMERQLIYLLNWDIRVENEDMCQMLGSFLEPIKSQIIKTEKLKLWKKQQEQQQQQLQHQQLQHQAQKQAFTTYQSIPVSPSSTRLSPSTSTSTATAAAAAAAYPSPSSSRSSSTSPYQHSKQYHYQQQQQQQQQQRPQPYPQQSQYLDPYAHYRQDSHSSISSVSTSNSLESAYSHRSSISASTSSNSISMLVNEKPHSAGIPAASAQSSIMPKHQVDTASVDPMIEFTAIKEEIELNNLLKRFNGCGNAGIAATTRA